jgi:uncharacterized protein
MATETFIDTSGLYSFIVKTDDKHGKASAFIRRSLQAGNRLVTTDYIIDETATLLKARGFGPAIPSLFEGILSSGACRMDWMDPELFDSTKAFFLKYNDRRWSFTDCFSFIVMKRGAIREALTKDAHFREAGFVPLLV